MKTYTCRQCDHHYFASRKAMECCALKQFPILASLTNADILSVGDFLTFVVVSYYADGDNAWVFDSCKDGYSNKYQHIHMVCAVDVIGGRNRYTLCTRASKEYSTLQRTYKFQEDLASIKLIINPNEHLVKTGKELLEKFHKSESSTRVHYGSHLL